MGTPNREPQEYSKSIIQEYTALVDIFLFILGVPCLALPFYSFKKGFEQAKFPGTILLRSFSTRNNRIHDPVWSLQGNL